MATLTLQELVASDPDCIIFAPCGEPVDSRASHHVCLDAAGSTKSTWVLQMVHTRAGKKVCCYALVVRTLTPLAARVHSCTRPCAQALT